MAERTTIGTDPAAPPATRGYALNHLALIVSDMVAMRRFYGEILGMRHISTYTVSPQYDVTYMGYPRSDNGFQTGDEMMREMRYREGLLEFLHPHNTSKEQAEKRIGNFSHMGFVVNDVHAAEERMKEFNVPILKALGDETIEAGSRVAEWWALDNAAAVAAREALKGIGWANILLVLDPEGNVVEIQQRE